MKEVFRDTLVENIDNAANALHKVLTTEGRIADISETDDEIVANCTALMVKLTEYSEKLRAREVD